MGKRRNIYSDFAALLQIDTAICFAEPASSRRIHPPPFGLPPSLRGHLLTVIFNM